MTIDERDLLYEVLQEREIYIGKSMVFNDLKTFIEGYECAYNHFLDAIDETFRISKKEAQ